MTDEEQLREDLKLTKRVDAFGEGLSPWEKDLIDSCLHRLEQQRRPLSEKQRTIVERLDEQKVK